MNATSRWSRRLAVLPVIAVACGVGGTALAPAAGAAGIGNGTWTTPTANATVSGTSVALQFSTNDTTVTFVLPYGSVTATVSGGVATGTFDSTRVANGSAKLGADECNALGQCDEVDETVTVSNPVATPAPTPQAPTLSPSGGDLGPGATITINGSGSAQVIGTINNSNVTGGDLAVTLPYVFTVPSNLPQGPNTLQLNVSSNGVSVYGAYTVIVPDMTPPVVSKLVYPSTYFPVRDGYLDHFYAIFAVNEPSTAVLAIYKGSKVVSSGTVPIKNTSLVDLRAGDRLKPGKYQWRLIVTDTAGNVTKSPLRTVTADGRHVINHTASVSTNAASLSFKDLSGSCSSARRAGTTVVLASLSKCLSGSDEYYDIASANFLPVVKSAVDYGPVTVKLVSHGAGIVVAFDFATQKFDVESALKNGTTTLKLQDLYVGYPKPELIIAVLTGAGHTVTLSSISVSYVYKTLSKK